MPSAPSLMCRRNGRRLRIKDTCASLYPTQRTRIIPKKKKEKDKTRNAQTVHSVLKRQTKASKATQRNMPCHRDSLGGEGIKAFVKNRKLASIKGVIVCVVLFHVLCRVYPAVSGFGMYGPVHWEDR
jgi:hypothetical protein